MLLSEMMSVIDYREIINRKGIEVDQVEVDVLCFDSRKARIGAMFVCITGSNMDGHAFAKEAYNDGCRIFVMEHRTELPDDAFIIITDDTRIALARLSALYFGYPADEMTTIGVTGTKGKTTTSMLIYNVLRKNGISAGYIGSNGVYYEDEFVPTKNTTPESFEVQEFMRGMVDKGVKILVMEVSSQALKQARVHGIKFDICVFTNLAPDHIGEFEHTDFEDYKSCKRSLFSDYSAKYVVYNADDEHATEVVGCARCSKASVSMMGDADYRSDNISYFRKAGVLGTTFECVHNGERFSVDIAFPGDFSIYNALTAIAVCKRLGLTSEQIANAICNVRIKGRFETYELQNGAIVIIDYAHNGVSLKAALAALRVYEPKRLVCLFGSVGGRTKMRRAELGLVASRDADFCILTADNPDNESPNAIIGEIATYFTAGTCPYVAIPNRAEAIEYALDNAREGDIILFAGKGHEAYQIICGVRENFSESDIVAEYCRKHNGVMTK